MATAIGNWLWRLNQVRDAIAVRAAETRVFFSITREASGFENEEKTFPYGSVQAVYSRPANLWKFAPGSFWIELAYDDSPTIICLEDMSLHERLPATTAECDSSCTSAFWRTWLYGDASSKQADLENGLDYLKGVYETCDAALTLCKTAPPWVLPGIGYLSGTGDWPTTLLCFALRNVHPLLQVYGWSTPGLGVPSKFRQGDSFWHLNDFIIKLSPAEIALSTKYLFDAICQNVSSEQPPPATEPNTRIPDDGSAPRPTRLAVVLNPPQVILDGNAIAVPLNGAILVDELLKADGDWVAGSKLDMRADRAKRSLPLTIRDFIESGPGKGYRIPREKLT